MSTETKSKPPITEIREGTVKIAIWERQGPTGTFYTAGTPENAYQKDGKWEKSSSFDEFDLEALALAALQAKKEIRKLKKASKTLDESAPAAA